MWKTTAQTALIALSLVTFGTGCDLADLIDAIGGGGGNIVEPYPEPYPEPTPEPVPVDDCDLQLDQCLADIWGDDDQGDITMPAEDYWDPTTGLEEEACFDAYSVCLDITLPPPPPTCELELDDCLAAIYTIDIDVQPGGQPVPPADMPYWDPAEQACYQAFDDCVGIQPPPPPVDDCDFELDLCLQDIWMDPAILPYPNDAEAVCYDRYAVCIDDTSPPPPPTDACDQLFTDCLDNGVSFGLCEAVLDECVMNQQPPCPDIEPGYPTDHTVSVCNDGNDDDSDGSDPSTPYPMP